MNNRLFITLFLLLAAAGARAQLQANFGSDVQQGCSPLIVNFRDLSTGNPTAWHWDFGNGATSTLQNPSATYFATGTYTVKLTVTNANGANSNSTTKMGYITVLPESQARFTANTTTGCAPAVIQFQDQSTTPAGTTVAQWLWDFGDNTTATGPSPSHTYTQPGSYTVTLSIVTSAGCKALYSLPNYINVNPGVAPRFSFPPPTVCRAPASVSFVNNSLGPGNLTYLWKFGDGTTSTDNSPTHMYTADGSYGVVLYVTSSLGCSDTIAQRLDVGLVKTNITLPTHICPNQQVTFLNNSQPRPLSSKWYFSNGYVDSLPNALAAFSAPGTYTVKLVNSYSTCTDSVERSFTVTIPPTATFTISDSARCQPELNVTFTASSSTATSYSWRFGDGSAGSGQTATHTYTQYGGYTPTLLVSDSSGCVTEISRPSAIQIRRPQINFVGLPAEGCVPDTVGMRANVLTSGSVTSWSWNFGDGSPGANTDSVTHIYTQVGSYDVSLTITTSEGCTETRTLTQGVKVGSIPTPDFIADPISGCADPGIRFTNLSSNATDYLWNFGDGTTSTVENPLHVFADTGYFSIQLTAINNGCRRMITKPRYVFIRPSVSRFRHQRSCTDPKQIIFTDESLGAQTWFWDFGDNTTYSGKTPPPHSFPAFGSYTVKLTTTSDTCSYTLTREVKVTDPTPKIIVLDTTGCSPLNARFQYASEDAGAFRWFEWTFGDGSAPDSTLPFTASHLYTRPGTYSVKLAVRDSSGCRYEAVRANALTVGGPIAAFGVENGRGCRGLTANFIDSSRTDGTHPIVSWAWSFGDSTRQTYTTLPFTHVYDSTGDFDVTLVVRDALGCQDSLTRRGLVRTSSLKANFSSYREYCPNTNVGFTNLSVGDMPFTSLWEFGNGRTSTQHNGTNTFTDTGYHNVTLVVTDVLGCTDSLTRDSVIRIARPVADFTAGNFITFCTPYQAKFTNLSSNYIWSDWSFGPGQGTSSQRDPYSYYTQSGTYPVKLVVTFLGGCRDSITKNMIIKDESEARMQYTPTSGCTPLQVDFSAFAPMNARFVWDFGDGNVVDTTINAISHRYYDFGNFTPRIIMREVTGACAVTLIGSEVIHLLGTHAKFDLDTMQLCDFGPVRANSDSTTANDPIVSYNWNFGDGTTYSVPNPVHNYRNPGQYDVTLVVRTQAGCTDTMVKRPVQVVASPRIELRADSSICLNDRIRYEGIALNTDTSVWRWNWTFPNGNTSTQQNPDPQIYNTPGSYEVLLTAVNSTGCRDSARQQIVVHDLPTMTLPGTITKIVGVPAIITGTYSSGIRKWNWTPTDNLSCADCPQPVATPSYSTLYRLTCTDSNGCQVRGQVQVLVLCQGAKVFVPNTFSPNGDGANDMFYVQGTGMARMKSLRVFNRWGEVVFERRDFSVNDPAVGWDGTYKGQKAAPDVYVYQLEVFCENSEVLKFEGNVALIR